MTREDFINSLNDLCSAKVISGDFRDVFADLAMEQDIVHCHECKYYLPDPSNPTVNFCHRIHDYDGYTIPIRTKEEDFCSKGMRD